MFLSTSIFFRDFNMNSRSLPEGGEGWAGDCHKGLDKSGSCQWHARRHIMGIPTKCK